MSNWSIALAGGKIPDVPREAGGASIRISVESGTINSGLGSAYSFFQVKPGGTSPALSVVRGNIVIRSIILILYASEKMFFETTAVQHFEPMETVSTCVGTTSRVKPKAVVHTAHFAVTLGIDVVVPVGRAGQAGVTTIVLGQAVHGGVGNTVFVYVQVEDVGGVLGCNCV